MNNRIEEDRKLPANSMKRIHKAEDDFAKEVYGNEYGKIQRETCRAS